MKRLYYLLILSVIAGCKPAANTNPNHTVKPMPASEIAFIKKVTTLDSVYGSQKNEITKKEYLPKGKKELEAYILKNLDVKDWVVKVDEIKVDSAAIAYIKVTMFVPIGDWRKEKYPDLNFPVFSALLTTKESKLKTQLKSIEKLDEVYVTGKIVKTLNGGINITSTSPSVIDDDVRVFSNLALDLDLTDIRKTH
jgi:hypothetical protein